VQAQNLAMNSRQLPITARRLTLMLTKKNWTCAPWQEKSLAMRSDAPGQPAQRQRP
jgi:hypothetical protein